MSSLSFRFNHHAEQEVPENDVINMATLFLFPKNGIISESGNKLCRWLIARFMGRRHLIFLTIAAKLLNGVIDILLCKRSILISASLLTLIGLRL